MNRDFKGIWIPKEIYLNDDLNWTEKILLIEIDSLDNEKGCYASNEYLAKFLSKSKRHIQRSLKTLKENGYIREESFDGRKRVLRSNLRYFISGVTKMSGQTRQKCQGGEHSPNKASHSRKDEKNTSINTFNNIQTEEEEGQNFIQKISKKYQQIYSRKLSVELYQKILNYYDNPEIIFKALEVAEINSDKPAYLLKILQDWKNNGLTSISSINTYLEERQAQNSINQANKQQTATKEKSLDELYKEGYR